MIKKKVIKTIKEYNLIEENQHIVIGLSGGPDSVCLFYLLLEMKDQMNLELHPVHINHKFRPGAAEEDQNYVEELCEKNGCKCTTYEVDCNRIAEEKKISSEEAGRLVRYGAFAHVCEKLREQGIPGENIKIAVAQNADDQAETILFRILRGTGTDGLSGIKYKRQDQYGNEIIRPVLDLTRKEIEKYCEEKGLKPQIDKTNLEPVYTRNKIRLNLIPFIEREFNSAIKETLVRMGRNASEDSDYIWQQALKEYRECVKEKNEFSVILDGRKLKVLHPALMMRIISMALSEIGITDDISTAHFQACESIVLNNKPSARADLPCDSYITKVYDDVKIAKETEEEAIDIKKSVLSLEELEKTERKKDLSACFDYDKLAEIFGADFEKNIMVRKRQPGDYIAISEDHNKKLQNYFVDKKIPKDERDKIDLLTIGHEILWILPGKYKGRYSSRYKLCPDTKKAFFIEMIRYI